MEERIRHACEKNNVDYFRRLVAEAQESEVPGLFRGALNCSLRENALSILKYVLANGAKVSDVHIEPYNNQKRLPAPALEILLAHGWNVNADKSAMYSYIGDEAMVRWLLDHGYQVQPDDTMILGTAATCGSSQTFKLLRSHGATVIDPNVLFPLASRSGTGGECEDTRTPPQARNPDMLRYLICELKINPNPNAPSVDPANLRVKGHPLNCSIYDASTGRDILRTRMKEGPSIFTPPSKRTGAYPGEVVIRTLWADEHGNFAIESPSRSQPEILEMEEWQQDN